MSRSLDLFVKEQLSPHISSDFETFVAFLEAYYEWLSKETQPGGKLLKHQTNIDIDESLDEFAQDFIKSFTESFPSATRLSPKKVAKQLRNIYTSKGSEQSFKLLFRILFSDEIDIKYPGNDVLIASGGDFRKETSIRVIMEPGRINTPFTFEQRTINFYDETSATPDSPVGFAVVDRVSYFFEGSIPVYELFLTKGSIRGIIKPELKVAINGLSLTDDDTSVCYVLPTTVDVSIVKNLTGKPIYTGEVNEGQIYEAKGQDEFFTVVSTLGSDLFVIPANTLPTFTAKLYVGQEIVGNNIRVGSYIKSISRNAGGIPIEFRLTTTAKASGSFTATAESRGTYVVVRAIDNETGDPTNLDILRYGINYYKDYEETLILSEQNSVKTIRVKFTSGAIADYEGTFKGNGGKLSDIVRLQDKSKYQKFAYVIQSGVAVNNWRNVVKELLNPAGFVFFGELALKNRINLSAKIVAANVTDIIRFFRDVCDVIDSRRKHVHKQRISILNQPGSVRKTVGGADHLLKPRLSLLTNIGSSRSKVIAKPRESLQVNYQSFDLLNFNKFIVSSVTLFQSTHRNRLLKQILPNTIDQVEVYFNGDYFINNDDYVLRNFLTVIRVEDSINIFKNGTQVR